MTSTNPHLLSLEDARTLLAKVNYRSDWSVSELIEAAQHLSPIETVMLQQALRCVAASEFAEAHMLERYAEERRQ